MADQRTVLVTGATGQQGGAVARMLLDGGHRVRALARRPDAEAAQALEARGAEIVQGDFEDRSSLEDAAKGADTVFLMSQFFEAGPEGETRQGKALADAAAAVGVDHLVYSSVGSADQETGIPHFESKREIERHIAELGLRHTIIRPVYFMENTLAFWLPGLQQGKLTVPVSPSTRLQQVSVADVAAFAALAVEDPERFVGLEVDVAGDQVTGEEAAAIITRSSGRTITYEELCPSRAFARRARTSRSCTSGSTAWATTSTSTPVPGGGVGELRGMGGCPGLERARLTAAERSPPLQAYVRDATL